MAKILRIFHEIHYLFIHSASLFWANNHFGGKEVVILSIMFVKLRCKILLIKKNVCSEKTLRLIKYKDLISGGDKHKPSPAMDSVFSGRVNSVEIHMMNRGCGLFYM